MKRILLVAMMLPAILLAQEAPPASPITANFFDAIRPRQLGPTNMGGRIMDLAVYEKEPRIFYIATASGGLWKTENGGTTTTCVFDRESTVALGAVAVDQNDPNHVWVGTGEGSSRNSTSWGDGVYKSTDGGKTWQNMGLRDSKHIPRILIHPKNPNIVYVGALGHLWGPNDERGVYKTEDGGKTWKRVLFVNNVTGIADMAMDPKNPNVLLAAAWERMRKPYRWASGGPGSGLYKSTDGGRSWRKITRGIPEGDIGRIGLSYFRKDPKIVVATIEARGGGTFRSTDGGDSWTKVNNLNPRPFYFSQPHHDPSDINRIYIAGVQFHMSDDQGKTFRTMPVNMHVDHHAVWIDPNDSNHVIVGNDGGVSQSRDRLRTMHHLNTMPLGQFYAITYDMRRPYWVYGGLQDNGSWGLPTQSPRGAVAYFDAVNVGGGDGFHVQVDPTDWATLYSESQGGALNRLDLRTGETRGIRPRPPQGERYRFNWSSPIVISPHNPRTIYFGGNRLFKSVNRGDNWQVVSPDLTTNDPAKQRPGAGVTPEDTGAERHCTIVTISESPRRQGLIWVGTDDGLVQLTRNDGQTWENVTANIPELPKNTWCSRVMASKFEEGRAYATFDGHRENDYKPYVYVTEDFGKTWKKLSGSLPENHSCYVIEEGERNPDFLVLGTEMGMWMSLDRGATWLPFKANGFPTVRVDDAVIHPRELDLIVGTHGRSIWIVPVQGLEEMTAENMKRPLHVARPQDVLLMGRSLGTAWDGDQVYSSRNTQPGTTIFYHSAPGATGQARITITDILGAEVAQLTGPATGFNGVLWNGRARGRVAPAGDYRVTVQIGDRTASTSVKVVDMVFDATSGASRTMETEVEVEGDGQKPAAVNRL